MLQTRMTLMSAAKMNLLLKRAATVGPAVGRVLRAGTQEMRNRIISRVPVRTGNLLKSIEVKFETTGGGFRIRSFSNLVYAPAQEFNTTFDHFKSGTPPQGNPNAQFGFMRKALVEVGTEMRHKLDRLMRRGGE